MILRTKIILIIGLVVFLVIGACTALVLDRQKARMITSKTDDVAVLANIIHRGIENAMAEGNTDEVQGIIENIGKNSEIARLRIISEAGFILKSKDPGEIGMVSGEFNVQKSSGLFMKPLVLDNAITSFTPVYNKSECFGCHNPESKLNGIIEIKYDISRNLGDIVNMRKLLIVSNILTVLVVTGLVGFLITRMITKPLVDFRDTFAEVEKGNWDARITVAGSDELSQIGYAFNSMVNEVKTLYQKSVKKEKEISRVKVELDHKALLEELNAQLQYKVKEVETANKAVLSLSKEVKAKNIELEKMVDRLKRINEVGRMLSSIIDTGELLKLIIKTTSDTLRVERGSIVVRKDADNIQALKYQGGIGFEPTTRADLSPLYDGMLLEGRHVLVNEAPAEGAKGKKNKCAIGVPMKMKGQIIGAILLESKYDRSIFTHDELELLDTISNQAIVALENAWLYETVKSNYFGTIQSLVNALEASDRYTKGHSERVRFLGLELARRIGLDARELEIFEHAAILHDIGKIGIDTAVLNKEDELTSSEFSLIRAHPIIGDEILGPIGTLQGVRTTILQHHERYDGKGYPYGISGEEITLKARILAVIDTFDAMLTDRPYRRALGVNHTIEELRKGSGTQFDPVVVASFLELVRERENLLSEAGYNMAR